VVRICATLARRSAFRAAATTNEEVDMYSLTIRDYLKCAHSLQGDIFGPAQAPHIMTYEVEVTFSTEEMDEHA
jgi:hypothetical protein